MISLDNLRDFVEYFDLMDDNSNIFFDAKIELKTSKRSINLITEIMVSYDAFPSPGKLTIIDKNNLLSPYKHPEVFHVEYQIFEFINNQYLKISGNHLINPEIGKYEVLIYPI